MIYGCEIMTMREVLTEIEELLEQVPDEPWTWACNDEPNETLKERLSDYIDRGEGPLWSIAIGDVNTEGESRIALVTGNGPNSEKHARLMMLVKPMLPILILRSKMLDNAQQSFEAAAVIARARGVEDLADDLQEAAETLKVD